MFEAADQLKFEYAAKLRDEIKELSKELERRGSKQLADAMHLQQLIARARRARRRPRGAAAGRAPSSSTSACASSAACRSAPATGATSCARRTCPARRDARRAGALQRRPGRAARHPASRRRSVDEALEGMTYAEAARRDRPDGGSRDGDCDGRSPERASRTLMSALETRGLQARLPLRRRLRRRRLRALRGVRRPGLDGERVPAPLRGAAVHGGRRHRRRRHGRGGRPRRRAAGRRAPAWTGLLLID